MPTVTETKRSDPSGMGRLIAILETAANRGRTERYMARIDDHIADLSKSETLAFLQTELNKWFERYKRFQIEVFSDRAMTTTATAWDYAETIGALSAKIGRLERQRAAA